MQLGVHLPLVDFGGEPTDRHALLATVDAARDAGATTIAANDHLVWARPWLDGPTALAAVADRSATMELATTVALVSLRGPVALAKALAALDVLSDGRVMAGVGPGSSARDYDAAGLAFEDRWPRFEEATAVLRALLRGEPAPAGLRHFAFPDEPLAPPPRRAGGVPVWIGSWGSAAGLRRVARLGDGWLASAYNTTPERFAAAHAALGDALRRAGRDPQGFPNALATMWTWITSDTREADRVLHEVLAPLLGRDPASLREQLCVGPPERCAALLARYARAGCRRVLFWPLGDEPRQVELLASSVLPAVARGGR